MAFLGTSIANASISGSYFFSVDNLYTSLRMPIENNRVNVKDLQTANGTWTPKVYRQATTTTFTRISTTSSGTYYRIGSLCFLTYNITFKEGGSSTEMISIDGFPFELSSTYASYKLPLGDYYYQQSSTQGQSIYGEIGLFIPTTAAPPKIQVQRSNSFEGSNPSVTRYNQIQNGTVWKGSFLVELKN